MTSLPPENAPQLVTCPTCGSDNPKKYPKRYPFRKCVREDHDPWHDKKHSPVAAPENQARPTEECPKCHSRDRKQLNDGCISRAFGDPLHFVRAHGWHRGEARGEVPQPRGSIDRHPNHCTVHGEYPALASSCPSCPAGAHPPPDERANFEAVVEEVRECLFKSDMHYQGSVLASFRTGGGMHTGMFDVAELIAGYVMHERNERARAPQPESSEKESSTWNTPATNAGLSLNPSNSCDAEITGTISAPSASESSSPNQQPTEAPLAPSKLSAQESPEAFNQNFVPDPNDPRPRYVQVLAAYASSSNAALIEQQADAFETQRQIIEDYKETVSALEGQLLEAQRNCKHPVLYTGPDSGGRTICSSCKSPDVAQMASTQGAALGDPKV